MNVYNIQNPFAGLINTKQIPDVINTNFNILNIERDKVLLYTPQLGKFNLNIPGHNLSVGDQGNLLIEKNHLQLNVSSHTSRIPKNYISRNDTIESLEIIQFTKNTNIETTTSLINIYHLQNLQHCTAQFLRYLSTIGGLITARFKVVAEPKIHNDINDDILSADDIYEKNIIRLKALVKTEKISQYRNITTLHTAIGDFNILNHYNIQNIDQILLLEILSLSNGEDKYESHVDNTKIKVSDKNFDYLMQKLIADNPGIKNQIMHIIPQYSSELMLLAELIAFMKRSSKQNFDIAQGLAKQSIALELINNFFITNAINSFKAPIYDGNHFHIVNIDIQKLEEYKAFSITLNTKKYDDIILEGRVYTQSQEPFFDLNIKGNFSNTNDMTNIQYGISEIYYKSQNALGISGKLTFNTR